MNCRTRSTASLRCARALVGCALLALFTPALCGAMTPRGVIYPVSEFRIEYALDHPRNLPAEDLLDLEIGLSTAGENYTAPRPVDRTVRMRLSSLPRGAAFSATAIQHINQYIVSTFNRAGFNGVIVTVPDIEEGTGRDLRPVGDTGLRLRIWTGRVGRLTSLADGPRFASLDVDERTNHGAHEWIRERAPVQPGGMKGLLDVRSLEDYAAKLSRHRGRRVDAQLAPGEHAGTSSVNLRVVEQRPWSAYAQYSNTGTSATTKNRERFGVVHSQLLGRDDILRIDYTTGDFQDVHAVVGSYEGPFTLSAPDWRFRARGLYSTFEASEVGSVDGLFVGEQVLAEGSLLYNALQLGDFFLDVSAGARWHKMRVDNRQLGREGTGSFLIPRVGLFAQRRTRISDLRFGLDLDLGFSPDSSEDLEVLGNPDPDTSFTMLRWDGRYSFYLEPLIDRAGWEDPSTPRTSTLAHEIALAFRGQWAFGARLVPQHQQIAGGLFTVRGYKQAEAAGDNLILGSFEYRFHLPRIFAPDANPVDVPLFGAFRTRPENVYGRPDWDLILRLFTDGARVYSSDRIASESHETLFSIGGGIELQLLRNLNVRVDAGTVLTEVRSSSVGDTRAHVLATLLY